jgi:hypothetical protein
VIRPRGRVRRLKNVTSALVFAALVAQAAPSPPAADDAVRMERIRKALDHQPAITTEAGSDETGRPIFRMSVRAPMPEKPIWANWTNVPSYIRPNMPGYHYDYLQMVTPEAFRAGTLYSGGIPIGALLERLFKDMRAAQHTRAEKRAREEVQQALAELFACRANPSRPGC